MTRDGNILEISLVYVHCYVKIGVRLDQRCLQHLKDLQGSFVSINVAKNTRMDMVVDEKIKASVEVGAARCMDLFFRNDALCKK